MIFILARELCNIAAWNIDDISAIESLALSAFKGSHILALEDPRTAQKILDEPPGSFSAVTISVIKKALTTYSFQRQLFDHGLITAIVTTNETVAEVRKRTRWALSLSDISAMTLAPTTLLAENLTDAKIFEVAAKHFLLNHQIRGFCVAISARGGGGNTIHPEFEQIVNSRQSVCLAVTDSDEKWPGCQGSEVSRSCDQLVERSIVPAGHKRLSVRELENLIPIEVLYDLVGAEVVDRIREYEKLLGVTPASRRHCDIKDGVKGTKILKMGIESKERQFLHQLSASTGTAQRCIQNEDCSEERNNRECTCAVVPRIGGLGERFLDWLSHRSNHKSLQAFKSEWRESWLTIGEATFAWGCARPPARS